MTKETTMITRRDALLASAALPLAAAVIDAPLTQDELRVLAMTATPSEVWEDREHEYYENRIAAPGTEPHRIVRDLETRGLVMRTETPWRSDMQWVAEATPAGIEALRRAGIEV
jgi:hypothetical protein